MSSSTIPIQSVLEEPRPHAPPYQAPLPYAIVCGAVAAGISDSLMHSLDTVKTRMQGQMTSNGTKYSGLIQSFRTIIQEEGPKSLFSGLGAAAAGSVLSTAAYFGFYESIKRRLLADGVNPVASFFIASATADTIASAFYVPMEMVKTRLQLQGSFNNPHSVSLHNYRGTWHALRTILESRGIVGLYRGWGATIARDVPTTAIQFTFYESIKSFFVQYQCDGDETALTIVHDLVSGAAAGALAGALTTPLDVVKTYLQTQSKRAASTGGSRFQRINPDAASGPSIALLKGGERAAAQPITVISSPSFISNIKTAPEAPAVQATYYRGVFSALLGIYERNGLQGLFSGIRARTAWTGLQSMVMFLIYENLLDAVRRWDTETL
ncbi:mitochondrial carrier domain-containing protein [Polychytrium aggregatum]|uniref:mitochondrial carrier domain-containing protein n=1 Tax=Polychytrium aggregatum TaxID=110093 RepID=UPI0022FEEECA|nr:mitochondrial carrier domain-containing protein [Polychytrium aggregatum]KAI9209233.1 mitochondrial carrier domain-containing protein [Polychytrium aggregatum]